MNGQTLKHYQVEETLGKGGMGVVYRALDTKLQRRVALKILPAEFTANAERRRRFLLEARAAGAITHPSIAQIYDVDEVDGVTFMAMELVEGRTVSALIASRELDVLGAVEIAIQVGEGLAKAHEAGIVHRDVKSENIMVTLEGHAKLLDFGLAKLLEPAEDSPRQDRAEMETVAQTQAGMVLGTVAYMSPEQARGQQVDHRSDVFSLGVVLYHMAAGQLPFSGSSPIDTLHAIAYEETRPVTQIRANLPASLQRVISRAMRKRAEDRYDNAGRFVDALKQVQAEIETGISGKVPIVERLREGLHGLGSFTPAQWGWIAGGGTVAIGILYVVLSGWEWPVILLVLVAGSVVYRRIKHRSRRLVRKFASRIRKMDEVKAVIHRGQQVTVVTHGAVARTYVRINAAMDKVNESRLLGDPFTVTVRDDMDPAELRSMLEGPGVLHLRDDALGPADG